MRRMLTDSFLTGAKTKKGSYVELFVDPNKSEMSEAFDLDYSALNFGDLRGFLTITGHLFIGVTQEEELIHDYLLKIIADNHSTIDYSPGWETSSIDKILAIFIEKDLSVRHSDESYTGALTSSKLEIYKERFKSNPKLSYLEFNYDV